MQVIALRGNSNIGKSETINIVYQLLLLNGYTQLSGHFRQLGNPKMRDFIDVVQLRGIKIGIVSQGDYMRGVDALHNHLAVLNAVGCVKTICACNDKASIVNAVMAYPSPHFHNKLPAATPIQRIENHRDAVVMFSLI